MYAAGFLITLLVALADPKAGVNSTTLLPAPGFSPTFPLVLGEGPRAVRIDSKGSGVLPAGGSLIAAGFSSYTVDHTTFYFPKSYSVVVWPIDTAANTEPATLLIRREAETWKDALSFSMVAETRARSAVFRFVLPQGGWEAVLLVPGFAPVSSGVISGQDRDTVLKTASLVPAARVRGRPKDSTGSVPREWEARLRSIGSQPDLYRALFEQRPISTGGSAFDFRSLPVGSWVVEVSSPGLGSRRHLVPQIATGQTVDFGDIYLSPAGEIRATLAFPTELPGPDLEVRLLRSTPGNTRPLLVKKVQVVPREEVEVGFEDLDPDLWILAVASDLSGLYVQFEVAVQSKKIATLAEVIKPIRITGAVFRGAVPVENVRVDVALNGGRKKTVTSEHDGVYRTTVWTPGDRLLLAWPPAAQMPIPFNVRVPEGASEFVFDIQLPNRAIAGSVRDRATGQPIPQASVEYSPTPSEGSAVESQMSAETDDTGNFRLDNLDAAPLSVTVRADGYAPATFPRTVPSEGDGTRLDVWLSRSTKLRGLVLDDLGRPLGGVFVGLDLDAAGDYFLAQITTSDSGEFSFDTDAGPHSLFAHRCGYLLTARSVSVQPDSDDQTVTLVSTAYPFAMRLTSSDGLPVANATVRLEVNGILLPRLSVAVFAGRCGQRTMSGAEGNLDLSFLPPSSLRAFSVGNSTLLGSFVHSKPGEIWTLTVPVAPLKP